MHYEIFMYFSLVLTWLHNGIVCEEILKLADESTLNFVASLECHTEK